ncbi:hypothetical protein [Lactobacillus helveticus]|uniref:Uncharacterized protein n=1 Tax=Lactobacillus helveticus CIRM-BIA 953 TaxID=1226335 RepID=U4QFC5_LACHE|nr:hypothetical protein [Lactobacillus helveticus]CDI43262.1 Protein of unknown function [Lactobacillus helveticus CIRM-BIA 953]CDI43344.1 Protein of unknown function [Lactobacillus helveticus CIRM-BIA 953]
MTTEEQDYEHLSRILDSYVLRNDERRSRFVYSELILIARLRNTSLETVTRETANAVGEQANNPDIKEFIRWRMIPVRKTLIGLLLEMAIDFSGITDKRH